MKRLFICFLLFASCQNKSHLDSEIVHIQSLLVNEIFETTTLLQEDYDAQEDTLVALYKPLLEEGNLRAFWIEKMSSEIIEDNPDERKLLNLMIDSLLIPYQNSTSNWLDINPGFMLLDGNYERDSLIKKYKNNFLGDLSLSNPVIIGDSALTYVEIMNPTHFSGLGLFYLLIQEDGDWRLEKPIRAWGLETK